MNKRFFDAAQKASKLSDFSRVHVGCVLTYKNKIISIGHNGDKTHPIQRIYNKERYTSDSPSKIHAETSAISKIIDDKNIDWKRVELYNYRAFLYGGTAPSRPCKSCMALIKTLGIRKIHYTSEDGFVDEYIEY